MGQIPRERRITTRRDVLRLLRGRRAVDEGLELYWSPATGPHARATCITPKFGHTSVARNRLRRRLKELLRSRLLDREAPLDYLVRARPPAYELGFGELAARLEALAAQIGPDIPTTGSAAPTADAETPTPDLETTDPSP